MKIRILRDKNDSLKNHEILSQELRLYKQINSKIRMDDILLKSILSHLFAVAIHDIEYNKIKSNENVLNNFFKCNNFETTRKFGAMLISNLERNPLTRYYELLDTPQIINDIYTYQPFTSFVDDIMIDSMNIRQWEYGKYLLKNFNFRMTHDIQSYRKQFSENFTNQSSYWNTILKLLQQTQTPLLKHEKVLIAHLLKLNAKESQMNMLDYFFTGSIFINHGYEINLNENKLKIAIKNILVENNNLRKGRGPKL